MSATYDRPKISLGSIWAMEEVAPRARTAAVVDLRIFDDMRYIRQLEARIMDIYV